jgi:hypothetical protein
VQERVQDIAGPVVERVNGRLVNLDETLELIEQIRAEPMLRTVGGFYEVRAWWGSQQKGGSGGAAAGKFAPPAMEAFEAFLRQQATQLILDPIIWMDPSAQPGDPAAGIYDDVRRPIEDRWRGGEPEEGTQLFNANYPALTYQRTLQQLPDSYLLAVNNAIEAQRAGTVPRLIVPDAAQPTQSVSKTFHAPRLPGGELEPVTATVTTRGPGPAAGGMRVATSRDSNEYWPTMAEKLFARFRGSYDILRDGAHPVAAAAAISGRAPEVLQIFQETDPDQVWAALNEKFNGERKAMVANSYAKADRYAPKGAVNLPPEYAMAIVRVHKTDGVKYITMQKSTYDPTGAKRSPPDPYESMRPKQEVTLNMSGTSTFDITPENFVKYFTDVIAFDTPKLPGASTPASSARVEEPPPTADEDATQLVLMALQSKVFAFLQEEQQDMGWEDKDLGEVDIPLGRMPSAEATRAAIERGMGQFETRFGQWPVCASVASYTIETSPDEPNTVRLSVVLRRAYT